MLPELSPDGRSVVFGGVDLSDDGSNLAANLGSDEARPIPGTEGGSYPFWSPDGQSLGFLRGPQAQADRCRGWIGRNDLRRYGGSPGRDVEPGRDHRFSAGRNTGLSRVAASGGNPEPVTTPDAARGDTSHRWPLFLPDGRHLLYFATPNAGPQERAVLCVRGRQGKSASGRGRVQRGVSPGAICCFRGSGSSLPSPSIPERALEGKPVAVADGVGSGFGVTRAMFSASADGTLVYVPETAARRSTLEWLDRAGKRLGNRGQPMEFYGTTRASPDGKKPGRRHRGQPGGAGQPLGSGSVRGTRTRLTFGPVRPGARCGRRIPSASRTSARATPASLRGSVHEGGVRGRSGRAGPRALDASARSATCGSRTGRRMEAPWS